MSQRDGDRQPVRTAADPPRRGDGSRGHYADAPAGRQVDPVHRLAAVVADVQASEGGTRRHAAHVVPEPRNRQLVDQLERVGVEDVDALSGRVADDVDAVGGRRDAADRVAGRSDVRERRRVGLRQCVGVTGVVVVVVAAVDIFDDAAEICAMTQWPLLIQQQQQQPLYLTNKLHRYNI